MKLLNCFIEPNGKIHHVGLMGHAMFVYQLWSKTDGIIYMEISKEYSGRPSDFLVEKGWLKLTQWNEENEPLAAVDLSAVRITKKQENSLCDLLLDGYKTEKLLSLIK